MIELIKAGKYYPTEFGRHYVFRDVSLVLPLNTNIGVIGPNGAGKSTFLRLIAGGDIPSEGRIVRTGRISWPLGLTPGLQKSLTGAENARFAARIYGMSTEETRAALERIREVAGIGRYFDLPVKTYSAGMKQRVSFAISMAMDFDYYLFDEISAGGDRQFKAKAAAMIKQRLDSSNFILVSHDFREIQELCQAGILLGNGQLRFFADVEDALRTYEQEYGLPEAPRGKRAIRPPAPRTAPVERRPPPAVGTAPRARRIAKAKMPTEAAQVRRQIAEEKARIRQLSGELAAALAGGAKAKSSPQVRALRTGIHAARERVRQAREQRAERGRPHSKRPAATDRTPASPAARSEPKST
jgi:capsular polysaccharide transport system ATP-binding protein